jgi:hypothetical protein
MPKFVRCVGVDHMAYHVNVDQIAWMFRPAGARHTVIRFSGTPDALSVIEAPDQIRSHAGSGEHQESFGQRTESHSVSPGRARAPGGQGGARTPSTVGVE